MLNLFILCAVPAEGKIKMLKMSVVERKAFDRRSIFIINTAERRELLNRVDEAKYQSLPQSTAWRRFNI